METLEFIKKPVDGKLVIDMPAGWEGKEVIIKITESEQTPRDWATLCGPDRLKVLKRFAGTAKYPNVQIDKCEVYEQ